MRLTCEKHLLLINVMQIKQVGIYIYYEPKDCEPYKLCNKAQRKLAEAIRDHIVSTGGVFGEFTEAKTNFPTIGKFISSLQNVGIVVKCFSDK